jgi:ammonium transporter, Amt family
MEQLATNLDTLWILITAFMVFFMQAGFAMVETGFTRAKNSVNILMKNLIDFCIGSVLFLLIGFGFMFGRDAGGFIGTSGFTLQITGEASASIFAFWIFQAVFAATAATIVSGAVAERIKFKNYLIYSIFITGLVYPVAGHWIWGGGWLADMGMVDFAGSTVVHSVGGWAGLAGAIVLGPRLGKYNSDGSSNAIPGHNIPLATLGVFILWFGWYGFNPGSTLSAGSPAIATIAVATTLAAAAGALATMFYTWVKYKKPDASMTLNGALAGLVGITAGCAVVSPYSAIIIGLLCGIIVSISVELLDKKFRIDDPVGAVSVHGVCGFFGTLFVGFFAQSEYSELAGFENLNGLLYGGGPGLLLTQLTGAVSVFAWTFGIMLLVFFTIKKTIGLRVSRDTELKGLDIDEHGMEAYSGFQIFQND